MSFCYLLGVVDLLALLFMCLGREWGVGEGGACATLRASLSGTFLQGCRKPVLGVWACARVCVCACMHYVTVTFGTCAVIVIAQCLHGLIGTRRSVGPRYYQCHHCHYYYSHTGLWLTGPLCMRWGGVEVGFFVCVCVCVFFWGDRGRVL